jgi:hypothetical protein
MPTNLAIDDQLLMRTSSVWFRTVACGFTIDGIGFAPAGRPTPDLSD